MMTGEELGTQESKRPERRLCSYARAAIAPTIILILFLKAWLDLDITWDSWTYHYPFAARLWNIVTRRDYQMETNLEAYYLGHPLMGEWLEGLLWKTTGHLQAMNLVTLSGFFMFVAFLRERFGIEYAASLIGLLAIPLVQAHVAISYVDLPANLALSGLVLLTWEILTEPRGNLRVYAWPLFVCCFLAANFKFQMLPFIAATAPIAVGRLLWIEYRTQEKHVRIKACLMPLGLGFLAVCLILYVPIRDVILYGNPFYPFHLDVSLDASGSGLDYPINYFGRGFPPLIWLESVLETNRTFAQWREPLMGLHVTLPGDREGGFFNLYVIAHLGFFITYYWRKRDAAAKRTLLFFIYLSLLMAVIPQGYELRYYQFWMITLVSLNLILWRRASFLPMIKRLIPGINFAAFLFVTAMTQGNHVFPRNFTLDSLFTCCTDHKLQEELVNLPDGKTRCIYRHQPLTFLYASYWYRPEPHHYRIIARRSRDHCDGDPNKIP